MNEVYTAEGLRETERRAFDAGATEDELIERAAAALCEETLALAPKRVVVLAGGGNNGSDALSLALDLRRVGKDVCVYITSACMNGYVRKRVTLLEEAGIAPVDISESGTPEFREGDLIADGMLGIGCTRPVTGRTAEIVDAVNASALPVLAVDIPTGLNADTGRAEGAIVRASVTVSFTAYKQGQLLADGRNYCGRLIVRDIGLETTEPNARVITEKDVTLPLRKPVSNKGTYGNVRIIAGSPEMMGASLLAHESAMAALRSGAGYAVLCVPRSLAAVYQTRVKEELLYFLPDDDGAISYDEGALADITSKAKSIVIGMGLGKNADLARIISYIAHNFKGPLVVDGDGLNALAACPDAVKGHSCELLLTPHVREFERLEKGVFGENSALPDTDRTVALARVLDAAVAMKSATTVISDGKEVWLNMTGTPAMAKSGSGDVLGGMTGAFALTLPPLEALKCACYYFGKAGERAAAEKGERSVLASDVIGFVYENA